MDVRGRWTERLERFFFFYLFANPVLDLINGIYLYTLRQLGVRPPGWLAALTPTLLLRIGVLGLMCCYILLIRDHKAMLNLMLIFLAALFSVYGEAFFSLRYGLFYDAQYAARFLYNIAALAVFPSLARGRSKETRLLLRKVFTWSALMISGSIILCFLLSAMLPFKVGFYTYWDRFGPRGASGFYYAANEAVAILMLLLPVTFSDFFEAGGFRDRANWPRLFAPALIINAMLLVGTKTAFVALFAGLFFVAVYQLRKARREQNRDILRRCRQAAVSTAAVFLLLAVFGMAGSLIESITGMRNIWGEEDNLFLYIEDEDQRDALLNANPIVRLLLSGREFYMFRAGEQWSQSYFTAIFGVGRGSQLKVIEMDFFEVLFYYGIFGFTVMLYPYARKVWRLLKKLKGKGGLPIWSVMLGLLLTAGYAAIAGHVVFSVTGGFYFVLLLVYGELILSGGEETGEAARCTGS